MDVNSLKKSDKFKDLPETYVIFITEHDIFGEKKQIYTIDRYISGSFRKFGDRSHIIYVNTENADIGTPLGRMMHDFICKSADEMLCEELKGRFRQLKESEKGVLTMCDMTERVLNDGIEIGRAEGIEQGI